MAMIEDPALGDVMQNKQLDTVKCQWEGCIREFASLKTLIEHLHTGAFGICFVHRNLIIELRLQKRPRWYPQVELLLRMVLVLT